MRGRVLIAGLGLAVAAMLVAPGAATAAHDASGAPVDEDFVVGVAGFFPPCCTADIDAHSGPSGENATGTASFGERATFFGGPVSCLTVTGNRAVLGGPSGFVTPGGYLFVVEDNAATGTPDTFGELVTLADAPSSCPADLDVPRQVATSGDLVVHDAQSVPTSKEQCKHGGWRKFGFENQGQCLAFVFKSQVCQVLERFKHKPKFCPARLPGH